LITANPPYNLKLPEGPKQELNPKEIKIELKNSNNNNNNIKGTSTNYCEGKAKTVAIILAIIFFIIVATGIGLYFGKFRDKK